MSSRLLICGATFLFAAAALAMPAAAAVLPLQPVVTSGLSSPLYATHAPNDPNRLFVIEQGSGPTAAIKIVNLATESVSGTFLTVSGLSTGGERGLLGLAFDPDYNTNGYFYVNVTNTAGNTEIRRYTANGTPSSATTANPASSQVILSYSQPFANHNGGWMSFGPDGNLYIASGDGGSGNDPSDFAQNKSSLLGKMLRIKPSGASYTIPNDNPYAPGGSEPGGGAQEVWAYGLRNPWRNSFDRVTGDLYIGDVGQNALEEIDFQPANSTGGENYGWRIREGTIDNGTVGGTLDPADRVDPIYEYGHGSGSSQGRSVTGGYVYRGPVAELHGTYFFSDFLNQRIWTLDTTDNTPRFEFLDRTGVFNPSEAIVNSIASFGEDLYGNLYVVSLGGQIYRFEGDIPNRVETDAILPDSTAGGTFTFENAPGDGRWFDPIPSEGFTLETDGSTGFIEVGLPSLAAVNDADGFYTITSTLGSVQVAAGANYIFSAPVFEFSITGIDPAVDGEDPLAFPVYLEFNGFSNDFTMTAIEIPAPPLAIVPEPATFALAGLGAAFALARRRRG